MQNNILDFIGEYLSEGLREILSGGLVEHINLDEENMKLGITAAFDRYIEDKNIILVQNEVKKALGLNKVTVIPHYRADALGEQCVPQLIRALKENIATANGFLENSKFSFSEDLLSVSVLNGADILNESGAKEFLSKYLR